MFFLYILFSFCCQNNLQINVCQKSNFCYLLWCCFRSIEEILILSIWNCACVGCELCTLIIPWLASGIKSTVVYLKKWNSLVTWFKLFDSFLALYHVIAAKLNQIQLVEIMCLHCLQRTPQIANCFPLDFEHCFLDELVLLWQHPLEELLDLTKMQRREIF